VRLYKNFQKGTLTNSPGAAGTSFQSAEFATLPVVASPDVMTLVLDPLEEFGAPEVLDVTAHASGSTTCTVVRARDGSAAITAAAGMRWIATPTQRDWTPSQPFLRRRKTGLAQNLTASTAANLTFDTPDENLGGFTITSSSVWSPPVDGIYTVIATIAFASSGGTTIAHVTRRLVVLYNNTDAVNIDPGSSAPSIPAVGQDTNVMLALDYPLLASKGYAIRARQDYTATIAVQVESTFSVKYLRPSS
jgi:hypothetical protein